MPPVLQDVCNDEEEAPHSVQHVVHASIVAKNEEGVVLKQHPVHLRCILFTPRIRLTSSSVHLGDIRVGSCVEFSVGIRNICDVEVQVRVDVNRSNTVHCNTTRATIGPRQVAPVIFQVKPLVVDPDYQRVITIHNLLDPLNSQRLVVRASHIDLKGEAFHNLFYTVGSLTKGTLAFDRVVDNGVAVKPVSFKNHTGKRITLSVTSTSSVVGLYSETSTPPLQQQPDSARGEMDVLDRFESELQLRTHDGHTREVEESTMMDTFSTPTPAGIDGVENVSMIVDSLDLAGITVPSHDFVNPAGLVDLRGSPRQSSPSSEQAGKGGTGQSAMTKGTDLVLPQPRGLGQAPPAAKSTHWRGRLTSTSVMRPRAKSLSPSRSLLVSRQPTGKVEPAVIMPSSTMLPAVAQSQTDIGALGDRLRSLLSSDHVFTGYQQEKDHLRELASLTRQLRTHLDQQRLLAVSTIVIPPNSTRNLLALCRPINEVADSKHGILHLDCFLRLQLEEYDDSLDPRTSEEKAADPYPLKEIAVDAVIHRSHFAVAQNSINFGRMNRNDIRWVSDTLVMIRDIFEGRPRNRCSGNRRYHHSFVETHPPLSLLSLPSLSL